MKKMSLIAWLTIMTVGFCEGQHRNKPAKDTVPSDRSFYPLRLEDTEAIYFTPDRFPIKADGKTDVSDALQDAINLVKTQHNFGILFIPDGSYLISKTIYIPTAIRLIGYGAHRPLIILGKNSPGFQSPDSADKGKAKYMFWFTSGMVQPGHPINDAGASTFYSALSNIDLKIEDGNPYAVALRTHYAQHSFISHVDIQIGQGKAGMFDVGNEMEDVRFFGGDYGIYTTKASPGWPFMMLDTYFQGQRKAAIRTQEAGLTIIRMIVKDVPVVIDIDSNFWEKLIMEDCRFDQVSGSAVIISNEGNANTQISLENIDCRNVPVLAEYRMSRKTVEGPGPVYKVRKFIDGLQMSELGAEPVDTTLFDMGELDAFPAPVSTDIPDLPRMETWVNLKSLGAKGDGETDDTKAIQAAIDKYPNIYVPQGWYRVSETIKLKPATVLIGLSPIATQFLLADNTEAFGGFGSPKPLLEAPEGGTNIVSGIGLSTGASNPRAVACKWMAGARSYLNDVKFIGGHGSISSPLYKLPIEAGGQGHTGQGGGSDLWDTQYWSLWITDGGGGVFKNIWTANTYATSGVYVSNTSTEARIYALSVEHHVRNEIRFNRVSNWKIFALQLEEESRESSECQPMELEDCNHLVFGNLYMFRVIRIITPYPYSIRNWGSKNIEFLNVHNYSQIKYTTDVPLYDINTNSEVRPWEFTRLFISGNYPRKNPQDGADGQVQELSTGFEFPEGICKDSKGNIYFCDSRMKRIYKWSSNTNSISLLADYPWEPLSLACDKEDNLLVIFKYVPKPGYLINGKQEEFHNPPDAAGTSFSGWGNSGFGTLVYAVNPDNPDETIQMLKKTPMDSIRNVYKALYPAHRWRDFHDFNTITVARAKECFVSPDGVTIIPIVYDLARAASLVEAYPGRLVYVSDEYNERTVKLTVDPGGYVSDLIYFAEKGEFSTATDNQGNVYIADGDIYKFDPAGKQTGEIQTPERPSTIVLDSNNQILYITGRKSFYRVKIN